MNNKYSARVLMQTLTVRVASSAAPTLASAASVALVSWKPLLPPLYGHAQWVT